MKAYIANALTALDKYRSIKEKIAEASEVFEGIGYGACLAGTTRVSGAERTTDEETLSKTMWYQFFDHIPWASSSWRRDMQREYCDGYRNIKNFWDHTAEAEKMDSFDARLARMLDTKDYVLAELLQGKYNKGQKTEQTNHKTLPLKLKIRCAPEWKKSWAYSSHATPNYSQYALDLLDNLDMVCHFFGNKPLPETLAGQVVNDSAFSDSRTHHDLVNDTFKFPFFQVVIYKNGNGQLTLTTEALEILTKRRRPMDTAAPAIAATNDEQKAPGPFSAGETVTTELQTSEAFPAVKFGDANLSCCELPQPAPQEEAPKAQPEIVVHYSKEKGVLVFGDTKPFKDTIKSHGLRWLREKSCWYIWGSREKELGSWERVRVENMVKALAAAGCKIRLNIANNAQTAC
jgi:hypothetical protein